MVFNKIFSKFEIFLRRENIGKRVPVALKFSSREGKN
jgi:hypothetical protein